MFEIKMQEFTSPDPRYGIYPIVHEKIISKSKEIDKLKNSGFAGVVGNITYTREFPNDEKEWEDTAKAFRAFMDQGMHTWIYDENGYPSGSAGGAVIDENPDFIAEGLYCYEYWKTLKGPLYYRADVPGDRLYSALLLPLDGGDPIDVTDSLDERGTLRMQIPEGAYHLFMMSSRRLFDGTHAAESHSEPRNYICLADKEATEAFIRITYDNYAKRLQDEFGKKMLAFFTDEPSLIAWHITQGVYPVVPWHRTFPEKFMAKYGYPIELAVTAVVTKRGKQVVKRRCDFWEFVADGVAEGYFKTIQDWCHAHGTKFSGHMLEEEVLSAHVNNYGSFYRSMRHMDWPGIDMLDSDPKWLMDHENLPIARFIASFADINGEKESFTEFSDFASRGIYNRQIGLEWIIASVNWHHAMGINNFTSYYSFEHFSEEELCKLNQYTARLGYLLRKGKRYSRVAVLYPEATMWTVFNPTVNIRSRDYSEATVKVDNAFKNLSWELLERQIDYDYIDESLICAGEIKNGSLCYKDREYQTILFPAVKVLSKVTMDKIHAMLEQGVNVIFTVELPSIERESGEECDFPMEMLGYRGKSHFYYSEAMSLPGKDKIPALVREVTLKPDTLECVLDGVEGVANIVDGEVISSFILSHMRIDGDTRILFLTNMGAKKYEGKAILTNVSRVEMADPANGSITECQVTRDGEECRIPVSLRPYQGICYVLHP